jgi:hypothetical protein
MKQLTKYSKLNREREIQINVWFLSYALIYFKTQEKHVCTHIQKHKIVWRNLKDLKFKIVLRFPIVLIREGCENSCSKTKILTQIDVWEFHFEIIF